MERRPDLPKDVIHLIKLDPHNEAGFSLITRDWHKPIIIWSVLVYALLFPYTSTPWKSKSITLKALKKLISKVKELGSPAQMVLGNLVPSGVLSGYYSALWMDEKEMSSQLESEPKTVQ